MDSATAVTAATVVVLAALWLASRLASQPMYPVGTGTGHVVPGTRYLLSDTSCQVPDTVYQKYQIPGARAVCAVGVAEASARYVCVHASLCLRISI